MEGSSQVMPMGMPLHDSYQRLQAR